MNALGTEQSATQKSLQISTPIEHSIDGDKLFIHQVNNAIWFEKDLAVVSDANVYQVAWHAATLWEI